MGYYRIDYLATSAMGQWLPAEDRYDGMYCWFGKYPDDPINFRYKSLTEADKQLIYKKFLEALRKSNLPEPVHHQDKPDDNVDVSAGLYREGNLLNAYLRLAIKKNKPWAASLLQDLAAMSESERKSFASGWTAEQIKIRSELNAYLGNNLNDLPPDAENAEHINAVLEDKQLIDSILSTPDIAVIKSGFHRTLSAMLSSHSEPSSWYDPNFDPALMAASHPVLIISSGGLIGLPTSPQFRSKLEDYVSRGGTLIVFAQQNGYDFGALPGGRVSGYGWAEDQSCQFQSSAITTYKPFFAGMTSATPNFNVDGYFTQWPDNAEILLRRTYNDQPCMIMYPYGSGRVIAMTLYSDEAYGMNQMTADEKQFLGDLIGWAKDPAALIENLENAPGEAISFDLSIGNPTDSIVAQVVFHVIDADGNNVHDVPVDATILPGITETVHFSFTLPANKYGLFALDYSLKDSAGTTVYNAFGVKYFAGSYYRQNPDGFTYQGSELTFSVQSTQETYVRGGNADFNILLWNNGADERSIKVKYNLPHDSGTQCGNHWPVACDPYLGETTVMVPAKGHTEIHLSFPIVTSDNQDTLWAFFIDSLTGTQIGMVTKYFRVVGSSIQVDAVLGKSEYMVGESVSGSLTFQNLNPAVLTSRLSIKALSSRNDILWEDTFDVTLPASGSEQKAISFSIPDSAPPGRCILLIEATQDGKIIGMNSTQFLIPERFKLKLEFNKANAAYKAGDVMELSLTVTSTSAEAVDTNLSFSISDLGFARTQTLSFSPFQSRVLSYAVPISNTNRIEDAYGDVTAGINDILWTSVSSGGGVFKFEMALREEVPLAPSEYLAYVWPLDVDGDGIEDFIARLAYDPDPTHGGCYGWHGYVDPVDPDGEYYGPMDTFTINGSYIVLTLPYGLSISLSQGQNTSNVQWMACTATDRVPDSGWAVLDRAHGKHAIKVDLTPQNIAKTFSYFVLAPQLAVNSSTENTFFSGDTFVLSLENSGGDSAAASYRIVINDQNGTVVYSRSGLAFISAGGAYPLSFTLPDQWVTGKYHLVVSAFDGKSGAWTSLIRNLDITGVSATSLLENVGELYASGANIDPQFTIESTGAKDIIGAILEGRIKSSSPEFQGMAFESHKIYDPDKQYRIADGSPLITVDP